MLTNEIGPLRRSSAIPPTGGLDIENFADLTAYLRHRSPSARQPPVMRKLAGGVSNRAVWVEWPDGESWVLKQALPRLRVEVDWFSDPARIHQEALALRYLETLAPAGAIPPLIFEDPSCNLLAMRAVARPHTNWKDELLAGRLELHHAAQFGEMLGVIHRSAFERAIELRPVFSDTAFFESLRLEPYYGFTAQQVPEAAGYLGSLIEDTRRSRLTLVHGDYSPKNILIHAGRMFLLDHEVTHFGDPGFDVGFALSHLLSKANHLENQRQPFAHAAELFWTSYCQALRRSPLLSPELEARSARHALGCLLARVAGRSPLEYLSDEAKLRQREAVSSLLPVPPDTVSVLIAAFTERLNRHAGH